MIVGALLVAWSLTRLIGRPRGGTVPVGPEKTLPLLGLSALLIVWLVVQNEPGGPSPGVIRCGRKPHPPSDSRSRAAWGLTQPMAWLH